MDVDYTLQPDSLQLWNHQSSLVLDTEFSVAQHDFGKYLHFSKCIQSHLAAGWCLWTLKVIRVLTGNVKEQSGPCHLLFTTQNQQRAWYGGSTIRTDMSVHEIASFSLFLLETGPCYVDCPGTQYAAQASNLNSESSCLTQCSECSNYNFPHIFNWVFFVYDGVLIHLGLINSSDPPVPASR